MLPRELVCPGGLRISKIAKDLRYASLSDHNSSMLAGKCSGCNRGKDVDSPSTGFKYCGKSDRVDYLE